MSINIGTLLTNAREFIYSIRIPPLHLNLETTARFMALLQLNTPGRRKLETKKGETETFNFIDIYYQVSDLA